MAQELKRYLLDNPLFHHYDAIDQAAKAFAEEIGADEELCVKAARIACDPPTWESVEGLTATEVEALRVERAQGFRQQPKALKIAVVTLCFSAMVQGWIQSVINGANQTMPEYFKWKNGEEQGYTWVNNGPAIWKFAGVNAITYLTAGIFGCWFSDPLQSSTIGRRGAILASACLCVIASIGAACVIYPKWWQLLIWRGLLGLGLGAKASVTPIFGAEISPNHMRGTLVMNWQLFDALGILCGFSANLIFYWTDELAWRFQIASACIPAGALIVLIWTIPESPRWLLKKGKGREAFAALCALRPTPLQAAAELFFANAQIQKELEYMRRKKIVSESTQPDKDNAVQELGRMWKYCSAVRQTNYWTRIVQLFSNPRTRRAAVAASVVMIGQQLCAVNVLAFYSTVFIQDINGQSTRNIRALWLSWGLGLANFLFTFPAYWWIDKYGRRFLLLATYPGMILSLLGASLSFLGPAGDAENDPRTVRVSVFMFVFILFYSLGQGPVAFAYAAEVFPLFNREAGMSLAVFVNLVGAGLLTLFVPRAQVSTQTYTLGSSENQTGSGGSDPADPAWLRRQAILMGVFVGLCTVSMILIYFFVPETKLAATREDDRRTLNYISLEELNQIFQVKTQDCINYYVHHVAGRTLNNVLFRFRLREHKLPIEQSMHYWAEDGLRRRRRQPAEGNDSEGTQVEYELHDLNVETGNAGTDRDQDTYDADTPTAPASSTNADLDTTERAPTPPAASAPETSSRSEPPRLERNDRKTGTESKSDGQRSEKSARQGAIMGHSHR